MPLPFADIYDTGKTPYEKWRDRQNVPVVSGNFVEDDLKLPLKPWSEWGDGVQGCILNLGKQQNVDQHIIEIAPEAQTNPRHHIYESFFHVRKGKGRTDLWQGEGMNKISFEWQAGSLFSVPINFSYQLFSTSRDEGARIVVGNTLPVNLNIYRNEDFIWNNGWAFNDRIAKAPSFFDAKEWVRFNKKTFDRAWECNIVPDVDKFPLQEYPLKGPGVKIMRFTLCDNGYGCHIMEIPIASRTTVHRHAAGAVVHVIQGEGFCVLFQEGEKFVPYHVRPGSMYAPGAADYHGHFNTGNIPMKHVAFRASGPGFVVGAPKYLYTKLLPRGTQSLAFNEEPPELMEFYLSELKKQGVTAQFQIVED